MPGKLYIMNNRVPNAWLHLLALLEDHPKAGVIDLRPLGEEESDPQWKGTALDCLLMQTTAHMRRSNGA